jgi:Ser/Thr protein kinase RdoA (MazF antagonist)
MATDGSDFYQASPDDQVQRLGQLANTALTRWGLEGFTLTPVAYRENMTFRVDAADGRRFAFRIHQANYRTDAQIQSELDLMTYLNGEGIQTPEVVPATDGSLYTTVETAAVGEPRQCDMFEWIDGRPLRETGQPLDIPLSELTALYARVGRIAASIHNATERWQRPPGFDRPAWDSEGTFGESAHLGDFRRLTDISHEQRQMLLAIADKVAEVQTAFGKTLDRYGLSHCDFLAENIFICEDGLRLVDFDDSGESWHLLDICTAVFDLLETPSYEPCLEATIQGYREVRDLPDEHLQMMPAFVMARILSYLGWCAKKTHMPQTAWMKPVLLYAAEKHSAAFLGR